MLDPCTMLFAVVHRVLWDALGVWMSDVKSGKGNHIAIDYSVLQYRNEHKIWGEFSHYDYLRTVSHIEAACDLPSFAHLCV